MMFITTQEASAATMFINSPKFRIGNSPSGTLSINLFSIAILVSLLGNFMFFRIISFPFLKLIGGSYAKYFGSAIFFSVLFVYNISIIEYVGSFLLKNFISFFMVSFAAAGLYEFFIFNVIYFTIFNYLNFIGLSPGFHNGSIALAISQVVRGIILFFVKFLRWGKWFTHNGLRQGYCAGRWSATTLSGHFYLLNRLSSVN